MKNKIVLFKTLLGVAVGYTEVYGGSPLSYAEMGEGLPDSTGIATHELLENLSPDEIEGKKWLVIRERSVKIK